MCGKFTAMASWAQVVDFLQPLTSDGGGEGDGGGDEVVIFRVGSLLPVIIWDAETRERRTVHMRWGFPSSLDWRRPKPIHGQSETIDVCELFRTPFRKGQAASSPSGPSTRARVLQPSGK